MRKSFLILAPALLLASVAARASTIDDFTLQSGTTTITFSIPLPASPDNSAEGSFSDFDVPVAVNGTAATSFSSEETFLNSTFVPPVDLNVAYTLNGNYEKITEDGQQLYTGSESSPTLDLGTFTFTSGDTLTITQVATPAVTPEPSSIALLGTGLLGAAGVLRKRFA